MVSLIKLTENDKRLIIVLLLVLIIIFVIFGYVGLLVRKVMKHQAKEAESMLHDVIETGVVTKEGHLVRFGIRKNWRIFFRRSWIPFFLIPNLTR